MSLQIKSVNTQKLGTCPHGMPMGACPACNGGGGGGADTKTTSSRRNSNEMSFDECYAVWQMMKNAKLNKEAAEKAKLEANALLQMQNSALAKALNQFNDFIQKITPQFLSAAFNTINKQLLQPALNALKTLVQTVQNNLQNMTQAVIQNVKELMNNVKEKFIDISDKLAAIFGEIKNALEKNISERFKRLTKKVLSIFNIFNAGFTGDDEEEKKIEEDKRIFELKNIIDFKPKITKKMTSRGKNA